MMDFLAGFESCESSILIASMLMLLRLNDVRLDDDFGVIERECERRLLELLCLGLCGL